LQAKGFSERRRDAELKQTPGEPFDRCNCQVTSCTSDNSRTSGLIAHPTREFCNSFAAELQAPVLLHGLRSASKNPIGVHAKTNNARPIDTLRFFVDKAHASWQDGFHLRLASFEGGRLPNSFSTGFNYLTESCEFPETPLLSAGQMCVGSYQDSSETTLKERT
jgi:hypothetical protein